MKKVKVWHLLFITLSHLFVCLFSGALGWDIQMVVVSAVSSILLFILNRKINLNLAKSILITSPFFILYTILSVFIANNPLNYPVWIGGIFTVLFSIFLLLKKQKPLVYLGVLGVILLFQYFLFFPNYFAYQTREKNPEAYSLLNSSILDHNNNPVSFQNFRNKVVLFDIWHSACLPCIKQFPEIEKINNYFKEDSTVKIISLNFPLKSEESGISEKLTQKYSFEKLFFLNEEEYLKIRKDGMPLILIMDKNMVCRYAGQLNTDWNLFVGNAKKIIKKLKAE
jgi:thiol-disulfide isomerase/thioredoxin